MIPRPFCRRTLVAAILMTLPIIASCGGGGGDPEPFFGELNVADFVLPAGQTRKVTQDLTIRSTGNIQIDGNLIVVPGALVNLLADGNLNINGSITGESGRAAATRQDPNPPSYLFVGDDVNMGAQSRIDFSVPGVGIKVVSAKATGRIVIEGNITTRDGEDSTTRDKKGGDSGSIMIGSRLAVEAAQAKGMANATHPLRIEVRGVLRTGRGGNGFTDMQGVDEGAIRRLTATDGGSAGGIDLKATEGVVFNEDGTSFHPGTGGNGGDVGSLQNIIRGRDGAQPGQKGQDVVAAAGSGKSAGFVTVWDTNDTGHTPPHVRVLGGRAGRIYVGAGNGGPGGDGGSVTATQGDYSIPIPAELGSFLDHKGVTLINGGGNGGDAATPQSAGGNGGHITINPEVFVEQLVSIKDSSNGGKGWNGCGVNPATAGSRGGNGGNLSGRFQTVVLQVINAFRGGDGGPGNPPGAGGIGGSGPVPLKYPDGAPGAACPDEVIIRTSVSSITGNANYQDTTCISGTIGTFTLYNDSDYRVGTAFTSTNGSIVAFIAGGSGSVLEPRTSVTVSVSFNCSMPAPQSGIVTITGRPAGYAGPDPTVDVSVTVNRP